MTVKAMIRPLDFSGYEGVKGTDLYIPPHTQGALRRYVEEGYMPGGFLTAVLCNDLFGAVARADDENIQCLKDITTFVYNRMPADAWGSAQKMRDYTKKVWDMKNPESATLDEEEFAGK